MGIKTYNPYTPSRRHMTGLDFTDVTKHTGKISDNFFKRRQPGRNNQVKLQ